MHSIKDLFRDGAIFEDDFPRSLNHFFDPAYDRALSPGYKSPDWALEDKGEISLGLQKFSYKDAHDYFYKALTSQEKSDRDQNFGLLFQTLGQVIHHIQDMAQPQHVRNDAHCDAKVPCIVPGYVVGLYNPSLYETYTSYVRKTLPYSGYPDLDLRIFTRPRDFWTETAGRGIAQFTNYNFVSAGTNFNSPIGYNFPLLNAALRNDMDIRQLCTNAIPACPNPNLNGTITFFGNYVEDRYTGQTTLNPYATSYSLFDAALVKRGRDPIFSLNRFNFALAQGFLIPRAVAYSAGLINYFFRGKLVISLPDDGVYGIIDHSSFTGQTNALTGFVGFKKIKLKLRNATPSSTGGTDPEPMAGGKLLAVLKFHRDKCYLDDLSGQPGAPNISAASCRSNDEEIVVSAEQDSGTLSGEGREFTFQFLDKDFPNADPAVYKGLPINATDVYLQVVYRGPLGPEQDPKQYPVVVATKDISEPTYVAYQNASDYIRIGDKVWTRDEVNAAQSLLDQITDRDCVNSNTSLQPWCFNPLPYTITLTVASASNSPRVIEFDGLPPQRFIRIALLTDASAPITLNPAGHYCSNSPLTFDPVKWQLNVAFPFNAVRGIYGYMNYSCVLVGSNNLSGPDDRDKKMAPLPDANKYPVAVDTSSNIDR